VNDLRYDIFLTGQLVAGHQVDAVKPRLARLFKIKESAVERLFAGDAVAIKKKVDIETAKKYQAAIAAAGAEVIIEPYEDEAPTDEERTATNPPAAEPPADSDAEFTLAPAGIEILEEHEKAGTEDRDIDTSHLTLSAETADDNTDPEQDTPSPPDTSHISVAETGADILPDKPEQDAAEVPDTSNIDIAPTGSLLVDPEPEQTVNVPDTSDISLAPANDQRPLQEPRKIDAPAPDTSKLSLEDDKS
jgi:hypothetical protein